MSLHVIRKGLDLPVEGEPTQRIAHGPECSRVAFVADDFHGLKPRVRVKVGQTVRRGDVLCEDDSVPGVRHTAPGAGTIDAIHRGPRRSLQSIVIELSESERRAVHAEAADADAGLVEQELLRFRVPGGGNAAVCARSKIRDVLVASGMWTAFRTRPFSRVPPPHAVPAAIFVTAIDTNPLAADPDVVLRDALESFELGLRSIAGLSDGPTYLCVRAGSRLAGGLDAPVTVAAFAGPHPAGTPGLHIHALHPAGRDRSVWHIGYQDVVSIGRLLESGHLDVGRIVSVAGPPVNEPRLVRSRVGASIADFRECADAGEDGLRWISGSILSGKASDGDALDYMGRYDLQISVLREGGERRFLAWLAPGLGRISVLPVFLSKIFSGRKWDLRTDTHGSERAIMPIGVYERVMPMEILPTFLLRALAANDVERAEELGCLELDEEDLALCSYVDPGKTDFGPTLRRVLTRLEAGA